MAVNFFKTLHSVLSEGIRGVCRANRIDEDEAIALVKYYRAVNSSAYRSDDPQLNYNDPACREAYLYAYVGAHANLIDNAIYRFDELSALVGSKAHSKDGVLEVCSLGGGPGSELLGFVKFIDRMARTDNECQVDIKFLLIDKVQEWDESWNALVNGLEETFEDEYGNSRRDWPIVVHRSFLSLDLLSAASFRQMPTRFAGIDIFVFNHTVSELLANLEDFQKVFNLLVEHASDHTWFLFIDRNQMEVVKSVEDLLDNIELWPRTFIHEQSTMDIDEQKSDLGRWYERFERDPKLTWNVFYALAKKQTLPF